MSSSLKMYAATTNHFSTGLLYAMKSRFYTTTSDDQLNCWAEKNLQSISQSQTCTKKTSRSLFGCLLPVWPSITFWIPAKPLHLRSMFSKFIRCTKTAMHAAGIGQQKGPNSSLRHRPTTCPTTKASKVEWFGYKVLPHPAYSPDLLPTNYHFFKHLHNFLQGKCFHNQQESENAFQKFIKSWSMNFYAIGINKLISHWQKCVDCNGSYFD